MPTGRVRRFNEYKRGQGGGWGFIEPDRGGPDVFVHAAEVKRAGLVLSTGLRLSYSVRYAPPNASGRLGKAYNLSAAPSPPRYGAA